MTMREHETRQLWEKQIRALESIAKSLESIANPALLHVPEREPLQGPYDAAGGAVGDADPDPDADQEARRAAWLLGHDRHLKADQLLDDDPVESGPEGVDWTGGKHNPDPGAACSHCEQLRKAKGRADG